MISIDEFNTELFQELLAEADAEGRFVEDVFFDTACGYLTEAGEFETADRADYRGRPGSGIRVDGYGGDPRDSNGTLNLIILDFSQSDEPGRLVKTEMDAIFNRLENFLKKALDGRWRNSLEETSPAFGLADLVAQRWSETGKVRMFLVSNRLLSERVDGRDSGEIDGRAITFSVWDLRRMYRFAAIGHGREEIEIDLGEFGGALPLLPAHLSADDYEAYLAVVPGPVLGAIYDRWGPRLLEQNVRVFLQARNKVNKGIRNTLEQDPSMFFAYNNGITATAESVMRQENEGQVLLTGLKGLQIVNGGQTTASVHAAYRKGIDLSKVFVQMKLSIVDPDRTMEVVPRISEYANSQNRINAADFFSNHPFHVRLEDFSRRIFAPHPDGSFRQTKWFYERARGQFADARSGLTPAERKKFDLEHPRSQLFSKTDLAKFMNVWEGRPEKVSLGAQKNFAFFAEHVGKAWEKNDVQFNEAYFREAIAKAIVFRSTEKIVSNQSWYQGGYRANIVAYTIAKLANEVARMKKSVDFESIWKHQAISESMERTLAEVGEVVQAELLHPPTGIKNVSEWAKKPGCWDRISALDISLPKEFADELISANDRGAEKQSAKREQKMFNEMDALKVVVEAGGEFWGRVLAWGRERELLGPKDEGIIQRLTRIPVTIPSDKQAVAAMKIMDRLREEGLPESP